METYTISFGTLEELERKFELLKKGYKERFEKVKAFLNEKEIPYTAFDYCVALDYKYITTDVYEFMRDCDKDVIDNLHADLKVITLEG